MSANKLAILKKALLFVSIIYLLYTLYHAIFSTIFLYYFIPNIGQLPAGIQVPDGFVSSTFPWTLLIIQEFASSIGIYLRFFGGVLAVSSAYHFIKNDSRYISKFSKVLIFESLYFGLFIPSGINHIVLSFSEFTFAGFNLYTGASFLLQGLIIFPVLFILSLKLKGNNDNINLRLSGLASSLYVFGIWIKHAFFWFFALSMTTTTSLYETIGMINSILTLLVAGLISLYAIIPLIRKTKKINSRIIGTSMIIIGIHFVIYFIVAIWVPIYSSFLTLTEFWMGSLLIPGIIVLLDTRLKGSSFRNY